MPLWLRLDVVIFLYDLYERRADKKDYTWEKTPGGHYRFSTIPAWLKTTIRVYFLKTSKKFGIGKRGLHVTRHAFVMLRRYKMHAVQKIKK